jgi:hypothetical protein
MAQPRLLRPEDFGRSRWLSARVGPTHHLLVIFHRSRDVATGAWSWVALVDGVVGTDAVGATAEEAATKALAHAFAYWDRKEEKQEWEEVLRPDGSTTTVTS